LLAAELRFSLLALELWRKRAKVCGGKSRNLCRCTCYKETGEKAKKATAHNTLALVVDETHKNIQQ